MQVLGVSYGARIAATARVPPPPGRFIGIGFPAVNQSIKDPFLFSTKQLREPC